MGHRTQAKHLIRPYGTEWDDGVVPDRLRPAGCRPPEKAKEAAGSS